MEFDARIAVQYLKLAKELGLDTTNPALCEDLVIAVRFLEEKMKRPQGNRERMDIIESLGLPVAKTVDIVTNKRETGVIKIAQEIVLALFLSDRSRQDLRVQLLAPYESLYAGAIENMLRIASGKLLDEEGNVGHQAPYRDQVSAFTALSSTKVSEAFLRNVFLGEANLEEIDHLALQASLKEAPKVLKLDETTVVEASIFPSALPSQSQEKQE